MSDKWLVGADDLSVLTHAWEARLKATENPRHRAIIETVIRHMRTEGSNDLDGVVGTLAPNPIFIHDDGHGPKGTDEVRDYYAGMFTRGGLGNMRVKQIRLIIDDDAAVTEFKISRIVPWKQAKEAGYAIPEESGHYAVHRSMVTVMPFDEEARLGGEISYARQHDPSDLDRVPDDELSEGYRAWAAKYVSA